MRVVTLNLRAYPNHSRIRDLADLIARQEPDLLLVQECRRKWLGTILETAGLVGIHSHDVGPQLASAPPDGCAIAVRPPLALGSAWRLPVDRFHPAVVARAIREPIPAKYENLPSGLACRFSARTMFAEVHTADGTFVAGSFHATPGTSRAGKGWRHVSEWKPFFHGAVALTLAELESPFIFGIDANEPKSETLDQIRFHWRDGRAGSLKFAALLGLDPKHQARDLLREQLVQSNADPEAADYLALTYTTRGGGRRRFDHIWATPHFTLGVGERSRAAVRILYADALAAGTDHAMIVADLDLTHEPEASPSPSRAALA